MRAVLRTTLVLVLLLVPAASAQTPPTFIAGTGDDITDDASRGDGGPATEGRFHQVDGLDWSPSGSILVADGEDGRIRRITPSGNIVTNSTEGLADPIAVVSTGWEPSEPSRHNFVAADVSDDQVESWFLLSNETWMESVAMEDIDAHDVEAALDGYWVTDSANGTVWHLTFIGPPVGSGWHQAEALGRTSTSRKGSARCRGAASWSRPTAAATAGSGAALTASPRWWREPPASAAGPRTAGTATVGPPRRRGWASRSMSKPRRTAAS